MTPRPSIESAMTLIRQTGASDGTEYCAECERLSYHLSCALGMYSAPRDAYARRAQATYRAHRATHRARPAHDCYGDASCVVCREVA